MTVAEALEKAVIFRTGRGSEFVLETQCFRDLQTYLQLAIKLPSTKEIYETEFPKAYFEAFFKDQGKLYTVITTIQVGEWCGLADGYISIYQALQGCFVNIHTHCAKCKTELIPLMITFGMNSSGVAG